MKSTLPSPFLKTPKIDKDLKKEVNPDNPKIKKYTEKYYLREKQAAEKMSKKIAEEKRKKRSDFLFEIAKAVIVSVTTLAVEHFFDIVRFFQQFFPPVGQ